MTDELEFLSGLDIAPDRPDGWPLYPVLPMHRNDAEVGVLIASPDFTPYTLALVNVFDPTLGRVLALDMAEVSVIMFQTVELIAEEGWSIGRTPGYGLEHWRDWDRRTEPCPHCGGRGYKGAATLPVPCAECEATGTRVIS